MSFCSNYSVLTIKVYFYFALSKAALTLTDPVTHTELSSDYLPVHTTIEEAAVVVPQTKMAKDYANAK